VVGRAELTLRPGTIASVGFLFLCVAFANPTDKAKLSEITEHALQQSQLTYSDSRPFHLQATVLESTNPKSEYQAKIEQFWVK
jgi:hypothetical protein